MFASKVVVHYCKVLARCTIVRSAGPVAIIINQKLWKGDHNKKGIKRDGFTEISITIIKR